MMNPSLRNTLAFTGLGLVMSAFGCECEEASPISRLTPELATTIDTLDFGEVPVGAKKELALPIENKGQLGLLICVEAPQEGQAAVVECTELSKFTPDNAPFRAVYESLEASGAWGVQTAATREILIVFNPQVEGLAEATYTIRHNGRNGPTKDIALRGVGVRPQVDVAPQALDFGEVTVGQRKSLDLVLTNRTQFAQPVSLGPINQASLIFGVLSAAGAEAQPGQPLVVEVPGNGSATVQVWFGPVDAGQATNTLDVKYCPSGCDVPVTLLGQGVKPEFIVEPARLDFGRLDEGQASTLTFRVRNTGVSRLMVLSVEPEAGTSSEFSVAPQAGLPHELLPMAELTVAVTYLGTTPGNDTGRIRVETTAWDNPGTPNDDRIAFVEVVAESTGPDIAALPGAVNFGTLAIMTGMGSRNVILENQGNSPLTVSAITLNTPAPTELTIGMIPALPLVLQPGETSQLSLRYAPIDAGLDQGQLVIVSDDRDENPLVVDVAGVGGVPTTCALAVSPPNLNFGLVERGRTANLPVDARNLGAQPCSLSSITTSGDASFAVANGVSAVVPPGATYRVDVTYTPPMHGSHMGQLTIASDDPAQPMINVPLVGTSAPSELRAIPSDIDFATVPVTCGSVARAVTLYNTGVRAITINRVYLDPSTTPEFELCAQGAGSFSWCTTPFSVPQSIPAGGNVAFQVRYRPADIGADSGVIFVAHSASMVPIAIPVRGRGELSAQVTDRFTQLPTPQADVLFVVDNSCSMSEEQAGLGRNLGAFLTYAQQAMVDYQIGVTTTDTSSERGRFVNRGGARIITPMTANAAQVFNTNVNLGTGGSSNEQGLEAAYLALTDPAINNENHGFLRPTAALAIVVVSDEEDFSTRTIAFYENFFRNIKGFQNSSMFSFSAIVTPIGGCFPGGASDGARYIQIAQATGGVVESICTANWGNTLSNIGLNTFGLGSRFNLTAQPVPSTIAVTVNGAQAPQGAHWRYDPATNSVNFQSGFVPQANATIEVTYTVACLP